MSDYIIKQEDCEKYLKGEKKIFFDLSFVDPPFNQGKKYNSHFDNMPTDEYWNWITRVCNLIYQRTSPGGAIYFMQREKNTHNVIKTLTDSGWNFRNLIVWKKKSSAVPINKGFGKHYQIIVFAIKGSVPRAFNKLRIDPPLLVTEKYKRPTGMYVTDIWEDIRELTSGYFAGNEPIRLSNGKRLHEQQSPVELLTRIILSSTLPGDKVLDPFAGTGTTLIVARQLNRFSVGIEIDDLYTEHIRRRMEKRLDSDDISRLREKYIYTKDLDKIWQ